MPLIATSGPHSLVMLKVGSGQQNACTLYCFFFCFLFFCPMMLEDVIAMLDVMERKEASPQVKD